MTDRIVGQVSKRLVEVIDAAFKDAIAKSPPEQAYAHRAYYNHLRPVLDSVRRGEDVLVHVDACYRAAGLVLYMLKTPDVPDALLEHVAFWAASVEQGSRTTN